MWPSAARRVQWSTAAQVRLVGVLAGGTVAVLLGGVGGVVGGVVAALVATAMWSRWVQRTERAARARAGTDLPLAADLLAAALRAGAPVDRAAGAVGLALGGSLGERLERVGRALRLGATAAEAWAHVTDVGSGDRLARAAVRSAASGAALAAALERLAEELRAARLTALDAAARRAGVLVVLPLGLCFLPAFVLAGLVPVIVAVLGDVL
ncbi:MAG TPA: type II secretion system F family protein [Micromonosporaceae bacterium]|nr:type II secretion system F family protein [Micromonosporaceae bacterium]